jgi:uncharacterized protein with PIN domain
VEFSQTAAARNANGDDQMMNVQERDDVIPLCPHCTAPLDEPWCRELASTFGRRYVYFCPECRKILGVSHRKGFWMG